MWRRLASWPTRRSWPGSRSLRRSGAGTASLPGTTSCTARHEQPADRAAGHPAARRVHKVARETATLDLLSSRRLTLGARLGGARNGELKPFVRSRSCRIEGVTDPVIFRAVLYIASGCGYCQLSFRDLILPGALLNILRSSYGGFEASTVSLQEQREPSGCPVPSPARRAAPG
jgi:hypothetical protein